MDRYIDADALIADMQERYCKPCKDKGEDYHEVRCRACWVDDAINDADGFADNSIDIVRCKECYMCDEKMWCSFYDSIMEPNDFCSYGEREDE